jgi:hypothetical protein
VDIARLILVVIEWTLIVLLSLGLLTLAIDFPGALYADPCLPRPSQGCYPWGGEGPVAGLWNYASKRNYLASSIFSLLAASVTLLGTFVVARDKRIFALMAGVAVLYLGNYLLPRVI